MSFDIRTSLRQRDPKFRQMVLRAYNYQCAICSFNMRHDNALIALEAAHIRWKQHHGPCEVPNGLALCAIHHKAFDRGSIGLDENMRVVVSGAVNGGFTWQLAVPIFQAIFHQVTQDIAVGVFVVDRLIQHLAIKLQRIGIYALFFQLADLCVA